MAEETKSAHRILMVKPLGNQPLGDSRRRWENVIKMDVVEVVSDDGR
jgi:hypothetical protein